MMRIKSAVIAIFAALAGSPSYAAASHLICRLNVLPQKNSPFRGSTRLLKLSHDETTGKLTSESKEFELETIGRSNGLVQALIWDAGSHHKKFLAKEPLSPAAIMFQESSKDIVIEARYPGSFLEMEIGACELAGPPSR
jgi:hypothetical protein